MTSGNKETTAKQTLHYIVSNSSAEHNMPVQKKDPPAKVKTHFRWTFDVKCLV